MRPHISGPGFALILFGAFCILVKAVNDLGQEGAVGGSRTFNWTSNVPAEIKGQKEAGSKGNGQEISTVDPNTKPSSSSPYNDYLKQLEQEYSALKECVERFNSATYAEIPEETGAEYYKTKNRYYITSSNKLQSVSLRVDPSGITGCDYGYQWSIDEWTYYSDGYGTTQYRSVVKRGNRYLRLYKSMQGRITHGFNILACGDLCPVYDGVLSISDFIRSRSR